MAKAIMGRAKFKIQRRLGLELPGLGKPGALERRPYPPGQHGAKRKKLSDYTIRLMEKQKIVFHYGVREKQLVNYVKKSKKNKDRAWVDTLIETLETRLDNVLFRLNFAPSIPAAKQMISHGHVKVDGKKVTVPSLRVKVGQKVSLTTKGYNSDNYKFVKENPRLVTPSYLNKTTESGQEVGQLVSLPMPEDIPFQFEAQFLTEYYWKVK